MIQQSSDEGPIARRGPVDGVPLRQPAGIVAAPVAVHRGRWEEADLAARRALRLSPRDPFSAVYYGIAACAQFSGRNYDETIRLSREGIRQRTDFVGAHRVLTAAAD
jgi:hypothetical protein